MPQDVEAQLLSALTAIVSEHLEGAVHVVEAMVLCTILDADGSRKITNIETSGMSIHEQLGLLAAYRLELEREYLDQRFGL